MPSNKIEKEKKVTKAEPRSPSPCSRLSKLSRDGTRSAFSPYKPSTVLTNLQRGNVQAKTVPVLPERSIHELAAQGELFLQNLDETFSVDSKDENGYTPLMWASCYGQLSTTRLLLERGASPLIVGKYGETALLFASASGHALIVKELLKYKADVNHKDEDGNTALMYAAYENHALCAHELLIAGVNFIAENNNSDTAYDVAVKQRSKQVQAVIERHIKNLLNGVSS